MAEDPSAFVAIGRVMRPRGIQGEAFFLPLSDVEDRFQDLDEVRAELPGGGFETLRIERIRRVGKRMAVKFVGVERPEDVTAYRNCYLQIPRDAIHPLPDDTFYVFEVVGMDVVTEAGKLIGPVREVLTHPANDIYVVDRDGEEVMLPAMRDLMTVDREAGRIVLRDRDLEGLI